jgi:hypothetical protein
MPYSSRFPIGPGNIFRPLSAILLVGILGALISGWKTPFAYRVWLWLPVVMLTVIWIFTPIVFWPMRDVLYEAGQGSIVISTAELVRLVRRWVLFDWLQIVGIAVAFVSSVQAISVPFPGARN